MYRFGLLFNPKTGLKGALQPGAPSLSQFHRERVGSEAPQTLAQPQPQPVLLLHPGSISCWVPQIRHSHTLAYLGSTLQKRPERSDKIVLVSPNRQTTPARPRTQTPPDPPPQTQSDARTPALLRARLQPCHSPPLSSAASAAEVRSIPPHPPKRDKPGATPLRNPQRERHTHPGSRTDRPTQTKPNHLPRNTLHK